MERLEVIQILEEKLRDLNLNNHYDIFCREHNPLDGTHKESGAETTEPSSFNGPWINVRDYGAGRGGDDTIAIQNAINVATAGTGRLLFFPHGDYVLSDTLDFTGLSRQGFTMLGEGLDTRLTFNTGGKPAIDLTANQNVFFNNFYMFGGATSSCNVGILLARDSGGAPNGQAHFENVYVYGTWTVASVYNLASEGNTFDQCILSNDRNNNAVFIATWDNFKSVESPYQTIYAGAGSSTTIIRLLNTAIMAGGMTDGIGVWLRGHIENVSLRDCYSYLGDNATAAVFIDLSSSNIENLVINNLRVERGTAGNYAIQADGTHTLLDSRIENSQLAGSNFSILAGGTTTLDQVKIVNNTLETGLRFKTLKNSTIKSDKAITIDTASENNEFRLYDDATLTYSGTHKEDSIKPDLENSATWDPGNILDGNEEAKEVTVTGAALGDFAVASFSLDVTDLVLNAQVTAANTVTCVLANNTGGAVNLGAGTVYVKVIKK